MIDATVSPVLGTLVRLELVRSLPVVGRSLVMGALVTGILLAGGSFTFPRAAFILGVVSGVAMAGPVMNALRDKVDGGLDFLKFLPVTPDTLVAARLLALAAMVVPGAALGTAASALSLMDRIPWVLHVRPLLGIFLALASLLMAGGALLLGLVLRFELSRMAQAPLLLLAGVLLLDRYENRLVLDGSDTLGTLLTQPWFPPLLCLAAAALAAAAVGWAFTLGRAGIAAHSPGRDRMTW
ncbi:MAG TPA: hypothetical protein VLA36_15405 [Longimicrobiales bacterium]|nr:hypothetical protein [Longimicrobiales bacterium]